MIWLLLGIIWWLTGVVVLGGRTLWETLVGPSPLSPHARENILIGICFGAVVWPVVALVIEAYARRGRT